MKRRYLISVLCAVLLVFTSLPLTALGATIGGPGPLGLGYDVTVSASPAEGGTASPESGLMSGTVEFTATPNTGFSFGGWTVNGTFYGGNPRSFDITDTTTVVAHFNPIYYTVTTSSSPSAGGSVNPGSGDYTGSSQFTAVPSDGYYFINWTANGTTYTDNPLTINVTSNVNLRANFGLTYPVDVSSNPVEGGSVDPASGNYGGPTMFTATPNAGYEFVNWTINGSDAGASNPITTTVSTTTTVQANFQLMPYAVTVSSSPLAGGSVDPGTGDYAGSTEFTATANAGYHFVNWTLNGVTGATANPLTVNVTGTSTLVANFALNTYAVTVSSNPSAGGSVDPGSGQHVGSTQFTATPNAGYRFVNWTVNGVTGDTDNPLTVNVTGATTLVANFAAIPVKVLTPNGNETLISGLKYTITWSAPTTAHTYNLKYSLDNGATWLTLQNGVSTKSILWTVPALTGKNTQAKIRVIGKDDSNATVGSDDSDATFTIQAVQVTYPNGGEPLQGGSQVTVRWRTGLTSSVVKSVSVYYTMNGGKTWTLIKNLTGNPTSTTWKLPTVSSLKANCKVKVILKNGAGKAIGTDISNAAFTIN